MKAYEVLINGVNYLMRTEDTIEKHGFYTSRVVWASNEQEAEQMAIEVIRVHSTLKERTLNNEDDPPVILVDEIKEITAQEATDNRTRSFMLYSEAKEKGGTPNQAL